MLALGHCERGEIEVSHHTDGERYQRILSNVEGREVLLIGGTVNDSATLELYDLASSLVSYGVDSLTLVIPYFGYSTMERAVKPGEIVTAADASKNMGLITAAVISQARLLVVPRG